MGKTWAAHSWFRQGGGSACPVTWFCFYTSATSRSTTFPYTLPRTTFPHTLLRTTFPYTFPRTNSVYLYLTQANSSKHWGNFKSGNWLRICHERWGSPWWEEKTCTGYGPLLGANPSSQPGTRKKLSTSLDGLSLVCAFLGHCLCEASMDLHVSTWNSRL